MTIEPFKIRTVKRYFAETKMAFDFIYFVVSFDIKPVGKPRMTQRDRWNPSEAAKRYFLFKEHLNLLANTARFKIGNRIDVLFFIEMPKSWSKKKRAEMEGQPHKQKPDTDNLIKAFCDALTNDDSVIWDKRGRKFWAEKPRIIVGGNYFD